MKAKSKGSLFISEQVLSCAICGEEDYEKILIDLLDIGWGPGGDSYSFCEKCWNSKNLGVKILKALGIEGGIKLKPEAVEYVE